MFTWVVDGLEVGESYVWCLVIVAIFIELGRAEVEGGEILKSLHVKVSCNEGSTFYENS